MPGARPQPDRCGNRPQGFDFTVSTGVVGAVRKVNPDLVLDESPIAAAIGYAINQREALGRFLDDGRLPLSNNISERNLKREALGRKNWIFAGSDDGALARSTPLPRIRQDAVRRTDATPPPPHVICE